MRFLHQSNRFGILMLFKYDFHAQFSLALQRGELSTSLFLAYISNGPTVAARKNQSITARPLCKVASQLVTNARSLFTYTIMSECWAKCSSN